MFKVVTRIAVLSAALFSTLALAANPEDTIRQSFQQSRPDIKVESVSKSVASGLYEVKLMNGPTVYVTADGKHFFTGDLYELAPGHFVNIAEKARAKVRKAKLAEVSTKDMIIFPAEGKTLGAVYVFTDVDCGYCRKLHKEVPELNKMGVEVRYLAYPRDFPRGAQSRTTPKMVTAWCSSNRQEALTKLKNNEAVKSITCDNPVAEEYQLGTELGVTGTPAIVTTEGELIPGYMPAKQLARIAIGTK